MADVTKCDPAFGVFFFFFAALQLVVLSECNQTTSGRERSSRSGKTTHTAHSHSKKTQKYSYFLYIRYINCITSLITINIPINYYCLGGAAMFLGG